MGAISIIRISGDEAIEIVNKIFKGKDLTKVDTHTINYGYIYNPYDKKIVDEVLVMIMKKPRSFTMEDIVEINCHGGISTTNKILELVLTSGARLSEPGEFTKRAFLNGRIDLIKAEAIMDLINAKTEMSRKLAFNQIEGKLSTLIRNLKKEILGIMANVEVNIDYPEYEDIEKITYENLKIKIEEIKKNMKKMLEETENSRIIKEGIKAVIIGKPNVGKSSILNKLTDEEKAIVTDIPGTTRDVVEGTVNLDGIIINIKDTAGIRETKDIIEKIGVERSKKLINEVDLVIMVLNNNEELTEEDMELLDKIKNITHIIVINKVDLENKLDKEKISNSNIVMCNTINIDGLDFLKQKIKELFNLNKIDKQDFNYLSNARQISLLKEAIVVISDIEEAIATKIPIDIIETDLRKIWLILSDILGEIYQEDLINEIFSQFCLGK